MTICNDLRQAVLQAAMQGKLTEQLDTDSSVDELLVVAESASQIEGQRVKQKEITAIKEDDISFDIPQNWRWVKLGTVCTIARGGSPRPIKSYLTTKEDGINWIKIGDTDKNGKYIYSDFSVIGILVGEFCILGRSNSQSDI